MKKSEVTALSKPQRKIAKYWNIEASKTETGSPSAELWLYGLITDEKWSEDDVTPTELVQHLNSLGDISELNVHIFSEGGSVFAGNAIYQLLKQRKETVNIYIEGIAASIATVISMAGDNTYIASNAIFYVHNVMTCIFFAMLNKTDLQKMIVELDRISDVTIRAYQDKTGLTSDEIYALLDANDGDGTWLNAEEAVKYGFADSITPLAKAPAEMVAMIRPNVYSARGREIDLTMYKNAPQLVTKNKPTGGNKMANQKRRFKAELYDIECPNCHKMCEFDDVSGIVTLAPEEDATVAVPLETQARRINSNFKNECYKICCPSCECEFEIDTDPDAAVVVDPDAGSEYNPDEPLVQAKRKGKAKNKRRTKVKATAKNAKKKAKKRSWFRNETVPVHITCTECDTELDIDVDEKIEEVDVECPNCGAVLTADTEDIEPGEELEVIEVETSDSEYSEPSEEEAYEAYRRGVLAERQRIQHLNIRKDAYPQFANQIDRFIQSGSSVNCANEWIFKALAANPDSGRSYHAAARRDAKVLNKLGRAQAGNNRASAIAEKAASLAEKRGIVKNVQK